MTDAERKIRFSSVPLWLSILVAGSLTFLLSVEQQASAEPPSTPDNPIAQFTVGANLQIYGNDIPSPGGKIGITNIDVNECAAQCNSKEPCVAFSFDRWKKVCYLKNKVVTPLIDPSSLTAVKKGTIPIKSNVPFKIELLRNRRFGGQPNRRTSVSNFSACTAACRDDQNCVAFSFLKNAGTADNNCQIFRDPNQGHVADSSTDSGYKSQVPEAPPIDLQAEAPMEALPPVKAAPKPPPAYRPTPGALPVPPPPLAPSTAPTAELPQFPWPPPAASGSYVLPDNLLQDRRTVGEAVAAIISALEFNGYVERSFFQTEAGGVALVTRLERMNDDGSSVVGPQRWSLEAEHPGSTADLINFLRGLFFIDPGHYRVIVFILQDLPFSQSSRPISKEEASAWLTSGFNILPSSIAERPYAPGGHCTVLVYEFASDGRTVHVITSGLTGKQHLEKAGVLLRLGNVN